MSAIETMTIRRRRRPARDTSAENAEQSYRRGVVQGASAFLEAARSDMPAETYSILRAHLNGPVSRWRLAAVGNPKARRVEPPKFPVRPAPECPPPPY